MCLGLCACASARVDHSPLPSPPPLLDPRARSVDDLEVAAVQVDRYIDHDGLEQIRTLKLQIENEKLDIQQSARKPE